MTLAQVAVSVLISVAMFSGVLVTGSHPSPFNRATKRPPGKNHKK
jgi:hypothetical protein